MEQILKKYGNHNVNTNYGFNYIYNEELMFPKDDFSKIIFEKINKVRIDPQSFIGEIENAKANIVKSLNKAIIYKGKVRVALSQGVPAFNKAISDLKNSESMQKLIYSPQLTVELPKNIMDIKDKDDIKVKVENMVKEGLNIKSYWRDIIKDPETAFLLMIVDDNGFNGGMKRKDLLDPDMRYIGISSVQINEQFVCYLTLSSSVYIDDFSPIE